MNLKNHLTDQQLQEYLESNVPMVDYTSHINECNLCRNRLTNYSIIRDALKKGSVVPPLQIDVATVVSEKVFAQRTVIAFPVESFLYGLAFILLTVLLFFTLRSFQSVYFLQITLLTLPMVLFVSLSIKESRVLMRKLKESSYS